VAIHKGGTVKLAKSLVIGAAFFGLAAGSAVAAEGDEEATLMIEPEDVTYYDVYGLDEDGDGVNDGYLFIEESDTRG
jgi:hypothetical protein